MVIPERAAPLATWLPLVRWRRPAALIALVSAAVVLAIGVLVHGSSTGTGWDEQVRRAVADTFSWNWRQRALDVTNPALAVAVLGAVAVGAIVRRRWNLLILVLIAAPVSVVLSEVVLKPLVGRHRGDSLAYPSGHETGLGSAVCVLALVLLGSSVPVLAKTIGMIVLALLLVVGGIGLVGAFYHYATDIVGAVGVVVATTLATAMAIDSIWARSRGRSAAPTGRR